MTDLDGQTVKRIEMRLDEGHFYGKKKIGRRGTNMVGEEIKINK